MDGWSPAGVEGRIASLLETGTVGAVRDLFPYGVRILCPITLRAGHDVAGWCSWREVAEWVGAQYPPRRGLTAMIDSATSPEQATDVDRFVGCSAGPAIEIVQRFSRTASCQEWKAAIWTAGRTTKLRPAPRLKAPAFSPGRKPGFSFGDRTMPSPLSMMLPMPA